MGWVINWDVVKPPHGVNTERTDQVLLQIAQGDQQGHVARKGIRGDFSHIQVRIRHADHDGGEEGFPHRWVDHETILVHKGPVRITRQVEELSISQPLSSSQVINSENKGPPSRAHYF